MIPLSAKTIPCSSRKIAARLAFAAVTLTAVTSHAQISQYLPFNPASTATLRASPKKVFSHYFTPFIVSIDNKDPSIDYYTHGYLDPNGENGIHLGYGGYLRDRPLPRAVRTETNWDSLDMQDEVRNAIAIGLDGFTVDLLSTDSTNYNYKRVINMLNAANAVDTGYKIVLMPDMQSISDSTALANLIQTLAAYPAAYRLADNRLVVAPFNAQNQSVSWWQSWLSTMSGKGINIALVPVFQGWHTYAAAFQPISYGFSDWGDRCAANNTGTGWVNAASTAHQYVPIWMHPVAPQDMRPKNQNYREAQNTALMRNGWELGAIGKADWVQLITWNDYSEGTQVSPSTGTQHLFYDLSAYYINWFKLGTAPTVVRDCIYYSHRQHATTAAPDLTQQTDGAFTIPTGGGTPSDYIEAYLFLTANATLEVEIDGVITSQAVTAPRAVVKVPIQEGQPIFRIVRNSQTVASVQSRFPINNDIVYQDPQYHGGSSLRPVVTQVPKAFWPKIDYYQTESLTVAATTDTHRLVADANYSAGYGTVLDSNAVGDYVGYILPNVAAGTYDVRVGVKKFPTRGIFQLTAGRADNYDGTKSNVGTPQDLYIATQSFVELDLGNWAPGSTGDKQFRFTVTGKNAASSSDTLSFDYIRLVPQ